MASSMRDPRNDIDSHQTWARRWRPPLQEPDPIKEEETEFPHKSTATPTWPPPTSLRTLRVTDIPSFAPLLYAQLVSPANQGCLRRRPRGKVAARHFSHRSRSQGHSHKSGRNGNGSPKEREGTRAEPPQSMDWTRTSPHRSHNMGWGESAPSNVGSAPAIAFPSYNSAKDTSPRS